MFNEIKYWTIKLLLGGLLIAFGLSPEFIQYGSDTILFSVLRFLATILGSWYIFLLADHLRKYFEEDIIMFRLILFLFVAPLFCIAYAFVKIVDAI